MGYTPTPLLLTARDLTGVLQAPFLPLTDYWDHPSLSGPRYPLVQGEPGREQTPVSQGCSDAAS